MSEDLLSAHLCECGCGLPTRVVKYADASHGYVAGQPLRFRKGHRPNRGRRLPEGATYPSVKQGREWMPIHRLRAEQALGRLLPTRAVVHHADGSKRADAPLVLCEDNAYHRLLHARMRVKAAGGDPNTQRVCPHHGLVPLAVFMRDRCRRCMVAYQRAKRQRKRQQVA